MRGSKLLNLPLIIDLVGDRTVDVIKVTRDEEMGLT